MCVPLSADCANVTPEEWESTIVTAVLPIAAEIDVELLRTELALPADDDKESDGRGGIPVLLSAAWRNEWLCASTSGFTEDIGWRLFRAAPKDTVVRPYCSGIEAIQNYMLWLTSDAVHCHMTELEVRALTAANPLVESSPRTVVLLCLYYLPRLVTSCCPIRTRRYKVGELYWTYNYIQYVSA